MSGNLSDYLNDDCLALSHLQWPLAQDDSDNWSNESTQSDGENEPRSLNPSRDHSPQVAWHSHSMRLDSPPARFLEKQYEPRFSQIWNVEELLLPPDAEYTAEFQDSCSLPLLQTTSPTSDYALYDIPSSAAPPLPSPYFHSPPMTATTAGIEVAMPRPSKNYQSVLADRFAAGTPEVPSPALEMHAAPVAQVPEYANESLVIESVPVVPSAPSAPVASTEPVAGPSVTSANRKRRAESADSESHVSSAGRKKSRRAYDDALLAAATGPPGTKLYPKRLTTPYQAFLDQLVFPVTKRISEPTKWLLVGGQRSPAFGKLLWERLDDDVKKAWFDRMNEMREEWNKTASEEAQCPVQPKPKPETLPKIGKAYKEILGHIEPLVIAFFAGVESMSDFRPGGQPYIDQEALERAAQGKADVLGFGDDAKGGPLKAGVKPPGTISVGPSKNAPGSKAGTKGERAVRPLPQVRITKNSRQTLAQQLVPVEVPRSFRCGFVAGGDADRKLGTGA